MFFSSLCNYGVIWVFWCVCVCMFDTGQNRGSKYCWISGQLYIIELLVVLQWSSFWKFAEELTGECERELQACCDYHKEYVLLDSGNVTAGNTVRLAWCIGAVALQWCQLMSAASVLCVACGFTWHEMRKFHIVVQ